MHIDLSAVPILCNSAVVSGSGAYRSEQEWATALADLRPRFMVMAYRELCDLLRRMELGDLIGLVISPPYSGELLAKLQEGLSEAVGAMLAEDCAKYGESWLNADLACGTHTRSEAALSAIEAQRATPDQLEQLRPLALQLAASPEENWFREAWLPTAAVNPLVTLTGGLEGSLGQRIKSLASTRTWEFILEDYPDRVDEPLSRKLAEQALTGVPALLAGKPWPFDNKENYLDDDEMDEWEREMEALLHS